MAVVCRPVCVAIGSVAPQSFALEVSVLYLVMVVIGGLGSVWGAVAGAVVVTVTPVLLQEYTDVLPFLAEPGTGGVTASHAARYLFGLGVIAVVLVRARAFLTRPDRRSYRANPSDPLGPHDADPARQLDRVQ